MVVQVNLLKDYIDLIQDEEIKNELYRLMQFPEVQAAFSKGSTYAGSNHPADENKPYGLLLHTLRVANVAVQLARSGEGVNSETYDILIASAILHDIPYKFKENGYTDMAHAHKNSLWFVENTKLTGDKKDKILTCILNHMGKWDSYGMSDKEKYPPNELSVIIHLADNLASRKNIYVNIDCVDYLKSNLD